MQKIPPYHHASGVKACFDIACFFPRKKCIEQYDLDIRIISEAWEIFVSFSRKDSYTWDIEKGAFVTQFWVRKDKHHFWGILHMWRRVHSLFWPEKICLVRDMWKGYCQNPSQIFMGNVLKRGDSQRWLKLVCQFTKFEWLKNPGKKLFGGHFPTRIDFCIWIILIMFNYQWKL